MTTKIKTIKIEVVKETEKAVNIKHQGRSFWVPKSVCAINGDQMEVAEWFWFKEIYCKMPQVNTNAEYLKW